MNLREKVVVEGLPYVWSTNLTDDDVREFYELYANQIREPDPPEETPTKGKVVFRIPCRVAFLEFRDGVCLWTASADKHHVFYRTIVLRHQDGRQTYVAMHMGDVPTGTFRSILKQSGLTEEEFRNL